MKTIEQVAAEILVNSRYAIFMNSNDGRVIKPYGDWIDADPFADTIEGRRQADAIEDWLVLNGWHREMWTPIAPVKTGSSHLERISRIKHCLEQLIPERTAKTTPQTD